MVHYRIEELIAIGCIQKPTGSSSAHSYQTQFSGMPSAWETRGSWAEMARGGITPISHILP